MKSRSLFPAHVGLIHFVGIGGIGMSAIAEILRGMGYQVRGSDQHSNANVKRLIDKGVGVYIGHDKAHVEGAGVVVLSSAIKPDNPEWMAARDLDIPVVHRSEMLAELMRLHHGIAIAGTHGKTTTTAMVCHLLESGDVNPTLINGGVVTHLGSNARIGESDWMVVEADESDGTFTRLRPTIGIITNMEPEHMNHFKEEAALYKAFRTFAQNIPFYGLDILCLDDDNVRELAQRITNRRVRTYGFAKDADVVITKVQQHGLNTSFELQADGEDLGTFMLSAPGKHNVLNATAALMAGREVGVDWPVLKKALAHFKGVGRRFTLIGKKDGATFIDDYAHHPTEITATLSAARQAFHGKIYAVVQPHRYSRLQAHFDDFASSLQLADHVLVCPVYAAGEVPTLDTSGVAIDHHSLAQKINQTAQSKAVVAEHEKDITKLLRASIKNTDGVVFMGAGSISQMAYDVAKDLDVEMS